MTNDSFLTKLTLKQLRQFLHRLLGIFAVSLSAPAASSLSITYTVDSDTGQMLWQSQP